MYTRGDIWSSGHLIKRETVDVWKGSSYFQKPNHYCHIRCRQKVWICFRPSNIGFSLHVHSRVFQKLDEIGNNANIGIRGFTTWSGNRTRAAHSLWFQVQHSPFYTNLAFACKTETLGSLCNHAQLIPTKSSKSRYQVVHEHKFKDLLSSTCQVSVEKRVLDLESEAMRSLSSIPTGGNILSLDFFHIVKPLMPILALLPISSSLWKTRVGDICSDNVQLLWRVNNIMLPASTLSQLLETSSVKEIGGRLETAVEFR